MTDLDCARVLLENRENHIIRTTETLDFMIKELDSIDDSSMKVGNVYVAGLLYWLKRSKEQMQRSMEDMQTIVDIFDEEVDGPFYGCGE